MPPHNLDAERAILGAVLLDREAVGLAIEKIEAGHMYRKEHKLIFEAMCLLYEEDQAIDVITVSELLERDGNLEKIGGAEYLATLGASVATAANVFHHARIVKEKATLRDLIHVSGVIAGEAFEARDEAQDILEKAQASIYTLGEDTAREGFTAVQQVVPNAFQAIEEAHRNKSDVTGLRTGFKEMDRRLGGLQKSDMIILAARPSMGKTSLALNIAYNVAAQEDTGVAVFSLEMSKEQLVMRLLAAMQPGFNLHDLRLGKIPNADWPHLTGACGKLSQAKIYIDDSSGITALEMKAKTRRLKMQHDIGLVVVDYLQLMSSPGRSDNRQHEISTISRHLKGMAKDLNVPVLALSQLSRAVEQRGGDHTPKLSDLRESGAIEQDADVVMFINREEVHNPDDESVRNLATIVIGKQRNGPIGLFDLHFHKAYTRFSDLQR